MTSTEEYNSPECLFCSTEKEPIFYLPTFMFGQVESAMVDGQCEVVIKTMVPAWTCPGCNRARHVTADESGSWASFWFNVIVQLSNVMNKTQFLESAPFGKKKK